MSLTKLRTTLSIALAPIEKYITTKGLVSVARACAKMYYLRTIS